MHVLITGANGFIGRALSRRLCRQAQLGERVRQIGRDRKIRLSQRRRYLTSHVAAVKAAPHRGAQLRHNRLQPAQEGTVAINVEFKPDLRRVQPVNDPDHVVEAVSPVDVAVNDQLPDRFLPLVAGLLYLVG